MDGVGGTMVMTGGNSQATATNTSGSPAMSSNNFLNLQLPTSLGSGSIGIDFGPNAGAISSGAYSFLSNAFNQQQSFVGSAIQGAQGFYSGLVKPSTDAASRQVQQNTDLLPQLYSSLLETNRNAMSISQSLAGASIDAQRTISLAGIKESSRVARNTGKPRGFCFITSACCEYFGELDDCHRLTMLRKFRDEYMRQEHGLSVMVDEYYRSAPEIVRKLKALENAGDVFNVIRRCYIDVAVSEIEDSDYQGALNTYLLLIEYVKAKTNG